MADESTFKVPFGILNINGLMTVNKENVVELPIFAHSTYPITTTLDPTYSSTFGKLNYDKSGNPLQGKSYQKIYRKNVNWNFGDGTEIEGYSATHAYDLPGKYTITCTFFDIHRLGVLNQYKLQVIVKQVIPTVLALDVNESKKESIKCSEITKIARIEALISNNVKDNVDVIAKLENEVPLNYYRTLKGTTQLTILYGHLQKPPVGELKEVQIQCRTTNDALLRNLPYYLGIWEQNANGIGYTKIGVSTNQVTQIVGKMLVWNFTSLQLSGRPIRYALLYNKNEGWLERDFPQFGVSAAVSTDGSYVQTTSRVNSVPQLVLTTTNAKADEKRVEDWNDIKDLTFPHLRKYQTFLEKSIEYYYNSQTVYKEYFNPVEKYTPEYEDLYGYFDTSGNQIVFKCYRVQPYANKERMPNISINNPNASILNAESFSSYNVIDVSTMGELPEQAKYIGKRAFIDIFYRSDFISEKNVVFFSYDIDNVNVHNSIESSTNFLNIPPLGLHFSVVGNDFANVKFSCTLNGFLTSYEDIDKLVQLSIAKNYNFNILLVPYFLSAYNNYYIPKDFNFSDYTLGVTNSKDSKIILTDSSLSFLRTFNVDIKKELNSNIRIAGAVSKTIMFNYQVKDLDEVVIPTEKYYNQNIQKLVDVYTPHELFQHTPKLKKTLVDVFENKRMLDYIVTKSINFFDDNVNTKTNYVNNLLGILHMMGKDAFEYDQTTFEGVNELKDLCRILSMNHSELVGNLIDEAYDIKYSQSYKGKHIGDEILITDELYIISANEAAGANRHQKGKITKFKRNGQVVELKEPTWLVVRDNYTNETKMVNFSDLTPSRKEGNFNIFQLKNYKADWGWGLLLPDKADPDGKILQSYYSFYLLCQPDHIIRVGNFLEEDTITPEVETKATWEEIDGKTFDKIQKVIHKALGV